jgi:steroid delta-isomerase-like uncharacterized protein
MSGEGNKIVARRLLDAVNTGDLAAAAELVAPDYVDHSAPPGNPGGPAGFTAAIQMYRAAFPDFFWTIEDMIGEGDKVAIRVTARGTHRGELMGIAPTGKQVTVTGIGVWRIADGKVAEAWVNRDLLGLLQQLGAIPAPAQTVA